MSITPVQAMKKFKTNTIEYKPLKKHWKLIQNDYYELDDVTFKP